MRPKGNGCAVAETDVEEAFLDTQPSPLGVYTERGRRKHPASGSSLAEDGALWSEGNGPTGPNWSEMTGGQE